MKKIILIITSSTIFIIPCLVKAATLPLDVQACFDRLAFYQQIVGIPTLVALATIIISLIIKARTRQDKTKKIARKIIIAAVITFVIFFIAWFFLIFTAIC